MFENDPVAETKGVGTGRKSLNRTTEQLKQAALEAYGEYGTVSAACQTAGIGRTTWYDWRGSDPEFDKGVRHAEEAICDKLEQAAIKRALDKSDMLMVFLLKGLKRGRYGDKVSVTKTEVTHEDRVFSRIYGMKVQEYIKARDAGTLPHQPPG